MDRDDKIFEEINNLEDYDEIYERMRDLLHGTHSIEEIETRCKYLTNYEIMNILAKSGDPDPVLIEKARQYYSRYQINDNKFIVIADSHIGRLERIHSNEEEEEDLEELEYLTEEEIEEKRAKKEEEQNFIDECNFDLNMLTYIDAYKYAIKNGIKYAIDLGDLIEGNSDTTMKPWYPYHQQQRLFKEKFFEYFPNGCGVKTFYIYGNHELNAINMRYLDQDFYKSYNHYRLIGAEIAYINLGGCLVRLTHLPITNAEQTQRYQNLEIYYDFELGGHSHKLKLVNDRTLRVPAVAGVLDFRTEKPGFLVGEIKNDMIIFKRIDDMQKESETFVFSKKLKTFV